MASNKKTIVLGLDYSEFSGGITEVNRKMSLLDAEFKLAESQAKAYGEVTDILQAKQEQLTQKIALQTIKVETAKKKYDEAMSTGENSGKVIDNLDKKLLQERTRLQELENQLNDTNGKLENTNKLNDEAAKKAESFGDAIRGMASSLGLEVSPQLEAVASRFDGISKATGTAIIGIGAMITSFAKATFASADMADDLLTLSTVTGITTDQLQKMEYASKFLDVEVDTMTNSITKLTRNMDDARKGSSEQIEAFEKLRVKYKDTRGELLSSEETFYSVIDALGKVKNETERDALAMTLMGKSAKELNPLIEAGSERLKELGIEAENMGTVMDENSLNKLGRMKDAMDKLESTTDALKDNLGLALLPVLTLLFESIGKIPAGVLTTLVVLASMITTIVLITKAIKEMTSTANTIGDFFKNINPQANKTKYIILGVVAALLALAVIIAVIAGKSQDLQSSMASVGDSMGQLTNSVNDAQDSASSASSNVRYVKSQYGNTYAVPNNYNGTEDFQGGLTWVGEEGPEIVRPPKGSRILSTEESEKMAGATNNYYINVDASNIKELEDIINIANGLKQATRRGVKQRG